MVAGGPLAGQSALATVYHVYQASHLIWRLGIRIINSLSSEQPGKIFDTHRPAGPGLAFYFLLLIDDLRYFLLYLVSEIPLSLSQLGQIHDQLQ